MGMLGLCQPDVVDSAPGSGLLNAQDRRSLWMGGTPRVMTEAQTFRPMDSLKEAAVKCRFMFAMTEAGMPAGQTASQA